MGAAEKEGLLTLNETLWVSYFCTEKIPLVLPIILPYPSIHPSPQLLYQDIWPDEAIWESVEDAEYRKKTTLEQLSQMTGGYSMPKGFMKDVLVDVLPFTE